jgi:hypothetical protein
MKLPKTKNLFDRIFLLSLLGGILLIFNLCIDPFEPDINEEAGLITVDGSLIKGKEKQTITISRASSLMETEFIPEENCNVKIIDEYGNEFMFYEESEGTYTAEIDDEFLQYKRNYKLIFSTPEGKTYESTLETLLESAPVDSFYYVKENQYSSSLEEMEERVQFYVDLKAPEEGARYYRWELVETYEYHSPYYLGAIYDGEEFHYYIPIPSDTFYTCWTTQKVSGLYSSNTVNLMKNEKKKIPLNYVYRGSIRFSVKYSLLIKQYALNEGAYDYWNQAKVEAEESGGLYTTQPARSLSNITNINDSEEKVLGFFWVSSCSEKRIFFEEPGEYLMPHDYCVLQSFNPEEYAGSYPVYLVGNPRRPLKYADKECFDCTLRGGSLEKPDFW